MKSRLNRLPHPSKGHRNGRSPVCVSEWRFSLDESRKRLPQPSTWQTYCFSPCVCMCLRSEAASENALPQPSSGQNCGCESPLLTASENVGGSFDTHFRTSTSPPSVFCFTSRDSHRRAFRFGSTGSVSPLGPALPLRSSPVGPAAPSVLSSPRAALTDAGKGSDVGRIGPAGVRRVPPARSQSLRASSRLRQREGRMRFHPSYRRPSFLSVRVCATLREWLSCCFGWAGLGACSFDPWGTLWVDHVRRAARWVSRPLDCGRHLSGYGDA